MTQAVHSPIYKNKDRQHGIPHMTKPFDIQVPNTKQLLLRQQAISVKLAEDLETYNQSIKSASDFFDLHRWWWIDGDNMIYDRDTGLLWQGKPNVNNNYYCVAGANIAKELILGGLNHWFLPNKPLLMNVALQASFPLREGGNYRLKGVDYWLVSTGRVDLDRADPDVVNGDGRVLAFRALFTAKPTSKIALEAFAQHQWSVKPHAATGEPVTLFQAHYQFIKIYINLAKDYIPELTIQEIWQNIDFMTNRLPRVEALRFTDVEQGMWEFYVASGQDKKFSSVKSDLNIRARNPALDIQRANVAIDFGTSSTVVAIRQHGRDELLRIGMQPKDYKQDQINADHYENATALAFIDVKSFLRTWKSESYRPLVQWDHVNCAAPARQILRDNGSEMLKVSSVLLRLKQWAMRGIADAQVRITDQQGSEHQLAALQELNPTRGKPLEIDDSYPELDPIELYAWFLGMTINWRNRGIFLKYYLTFPVEYHNDVKAKILASFRRGLQRSLPETLLTDEAFNAFSVEALASEPAAFAAAALERLKIEPTDGGVAYGVFDFGGGTTDFDYGFYRLPDDDELDEGWDHVIEHFGSSGDKFFGGENLLENMAFLAFKDNQNICRQHEVAFTVPLDAQRFAGSELLIDATQAAITNTTLMMSILRPILERGTHNTESAGTSNITLINRHGKTVSCDFSIKQEMLLQFLQERIREGLRNFFISLKVAFETHQNKLPELIHILLAGNASRSLIVLGLLGRLSDDEQAQTLHELFLADVAEIFGDEAPDFEIHEPLNADPEDPYAATAKTGVALGLLRLCKGETLKVVNHAQQNNADSPFQFFVGTHRRNIFNAAIQRGQTYQEWMELGAIRQGVFPLLYTSSPQAAIAASMKRGDKGLLEQNLEFSGDTAGCKVFAQVVSPNQIKLCTATTAEQANSSEANNVQILTLSL